MKTIETYTGKKYSATIIGHFDGHFWRSENGMAGVHVLNIALGAAFGCNDANVGQMTKPIESTRTRDGIYRGIDDQLYAINVNEAFSLVAA